VSKRIHVRTIIEPIHKYPVERIEVYPYHMIIRFRNKQNALGIFNIIKQGSKGKPTKSPLNINTNICFDHSTHFRKPTGALVITGDMYAAVEFMRRKMSPRSYNNLQYALSKRPRVIMMRLEENRNKQRSALFRPFNLIENVEISHRIAGTNLYQNFNSIK
jgi:hypothetical protein